ncbi:MAG: NADP-dependent malic enzyme [bacterium]|nr:NADP-dependent malic enzyme [bacterium]
MKTIEIVPKVKVKNNKILSLVYTPGVSKSCLKIKENIEKVFELTNRSNSIAVLSYDYEMSVKRAMFIKETRTTDAYPLVIRECSKEDLEMVKEAILPNFMGVDTTLTEGLPYDNQEFIPTCSKGCILPDTMKIEDMEPLELRSAFGGVLETRITESIDFRKPVAIISDGSAILGLGNIGATAGLPVMEGKAVLFKELGDVDAMPLCLNTQDVNKIKRIVLLLENSFSGVNLEDIKAPECFEIERFLIQNSHVPVFHDDQHGAAIVTLAGLYNALKLVNKRIDKVKIVISGAGAAGQAICRLLLKAGAKNIIMSDIFGIVYEGRAGNDASLEAVSKLTNKLNQRGELENALKGADVFIGVSAGNILRPEWIETMAGEPIVFALANPVPEIMPDIAKKAGAKVVASGRSDFDNQINNSLVFPGLFDGVINAGIRMITDDIKILAAKTLANMVRGDELDYDYIIPNPLDKSVAKNISACIIDHVRNLTTEHNKRPL